MKLLPSLLLYSAHATQVILEEPKVRVKNSRRSSRQIVEIIV